MKKWLHLLLSSFIVFIVLGDIEARASVPFHPDVSDEKRQVQKEKTGHTLYIDGQKQSYTGRPIFQNGIMYVTIPAAVKVLNELADVQANVPYARERSPYDYLKKNNVIEKVKSREVVRIKTLQDLGIQAFWYDNPGTLHLETVDLLKVGNLKIGDSLKEVEQQIDVHWNTGYGQPADYIGYHGGTHTFTYKDRYGREHMGEVPDLQLEITDGILSYMIISDESYETTKGISVGDTLSDVTRMYGSEYMNETIDGKTVYIYHVKDGSLWFIADEDRQLERIGLWAYQLEGYER
ncbi:hypothetical protein [Bacillus piscicola]|uniref:hypothetical protein n=1 Tax=Bacillus piscicola TaxID=1632684 RepID=UPI001F0982FA|nr:hypothetical protein [Bacillus piscicola]